MRGSKSPPPLQGALLTEGGYDAAWSLLLWPLVFFTARRHMQCKCITCSPATVRCLQSTKTWCCIKTGERLRWFSTRAAFSLSYCGGTEGNSDINKLKDAFSTDTLSKSQNLAEADFSVSSTVAGDRFITLSAGLCLYSTL